MRELQIEPYRGDHLQAPGAVLEQVIQSILKEEFCVAILTGHNPNVFYELAVAQCAIRPVIMMIRKGENPPFNVAKDRCIEYDFDPDAIAAGTYVNQLVAQVRALEQSGWVVPALLPAPSPRIPSITVAENNNHLTEEIGRYLEQQRRLGKPPQRAKVIQFSGVNATKMVQLLVEAGVNVELYLGNVNFARYLKNEHQEERIVGNRFSKLRNDVMPDGSRPGMGTFQLFRYDAPASIRAVLIEDGFVALGGFIYMMKEIDPDDLVLDVRGGEKPMFIVQAGHPHFLMVAKVVRDTIENWAKFQVTAERDERSDFSARSAQTI
jgi:hypothetical protein